MFLFTLIWKFLPQAFSGQKNVVLSIKHVLLEYYCILLLFCLLWVPLKAQFNPCNGKAQLGESCDRDSDCENKGSVCLRGACLCHPNYMRTKSEKGTSSRCTILPSKIDQECTHKCREPLFCRHGKCQCVQRGSTSILNGECVFTSKVGDRCSRHYDCTSPFSACVNSQCVCISGTTQQGSRCVATTNCPMGGSPAGTCTRRAQLNQISNFMDEADTCPFGQFCVTLPESPIGHCCPVLCPLNSKVDHTFNCQPGGIKQPGAIAGIQTTSAPVFGRVVGLNNNFLKSPLLPPSLLPNCPSDTHFCHYVNGDTFSQAVCCKRPCNSLAPEALYLKGECISRGQLNSECRRHEQCGAAEGMECIKGNCQCSNGFSPALDVITHPTKNPSQQCVKDCDKKASLSRDTTCLEKTQLDGSCFVPDQCPENSGCYRGHCLCRCGYRKAYNESTKLYKCVQIPVPTTAQPSPQPLVPSLNSGNNFFDINKILGIFGAGGGGPAVLAQQHQQNN